MAKENSNNDNDEGDIRIATRSIDLEMSAARLYNTAIEKFREDPRLNVLVLNLEKLRDRHQSMATEMEGLTGCNCDGSEYRRFEDLEVGLRVSANLEGGSSSALSYLKHCESACLDCYERWLNRRPSGPLHHQITKRCIPEIDSHLLTLCEPHSMVD